MKKANLVNSNVMHEEESDNHFYPEFLQSIENHFSTNINGNNIPIFRTDATGLFDVFLSHLPIKFRQHYTCHACRDFVEHFGNLVIITEYGNIEPVIWGNAPDFFMPSVQAIRTIILNSKVSGVFVTKNAVLGHPVTGIWHHMSIQLPESIVSKSLLKTPYQIAAEKLEDFYILINGLKEYPLEVVEQAVLLLETESLYRFEACLGVAQWLKKLHIKISTVKDNRKKDHIIWLAVATAPAGYCHIKSSMIGTLLDDIVSGLSFDSIKRRFTEKMNPMQYQRPQAKPTTGNIERAEKIIQKLGIQNSLIRRFARLDEIETFWVSKKKEHKIKSDGVFSHLSTKEKKYHNKMELPTITMTWRKFYECVLPSAQSIQYLVKDGKDAFGAIVTASNYDSPPIFQWDSEKNRNPFSHYVYVNDSHCKDWNLSPGFCNITGICYQPSMWGDDTLKYQYQGKALFFILEGAKDNKYSNAGNALFPVMLKSELHEIRSTIEAYSNKAVLEGYEEASACGIRLQYGLTWNAVFQVITSSGIANYKLDRWD